jgi:hypothetical protein
LKDSEFVLLETTGGGNLFPVGSVVNLNGKPVFWRDFDASKFLFKKGNYTAIFQDDDLIKFLETTPVKSLYFRDFRKGKVYKASLEAFKTARVVSMRGRKQRGLSFNRFEQVEVKVDRRRPEKKVIINN